MAKIVFTLYLIYPACRGARVLYQMHVDPEERARRRVRMCGCVTGGRVCCRGWVRVGLDTDVGLSLSPVEQLFVGRCGFAG